MTELLEYKGRWWVPDNPEDVVPGLIKYTPENGITLELIGQFKPTKSKTFPGDGSPTIINGYVSSYKFFTLIDCHISFYQHDPHLPITNYHCNSMIYGSECFASKSEMRFRGIVVDIQYLNDWMQLNSGFHVEYQLGQSDCKVEYNKPSAINMKIGTNCKFSLFPCVSFPAIITVNKATIEQNVYLGLTNKNLISHGALIDKVHCFKHLLLLLLQKPPALLKITFYKNSKPDYHDSYEYCIWQIIDKEDEKRMRPHDMLLDYRAIEPDFESLITNWFRTYRSMLNVYIPLIHSYSHTMNLTDTYLNICRAIEALGRHCGAPKITNSRSTKSHSDVVRAIVYLYNQYKDSMDQVLSINYILRFAWKVTKIRNDLTHANPITSKIDKDFDKIQDMIEQLKAFLTIAVLRYHGVSSIALNQGLNRSFVYSYLRMKKRD
ncbi:MAG: hypothetical protein LHW44_07120 [Candidatus Cloacimonetes bacterium]|nr:hypothetical protein [Candidatus Cloacimonadota bacterium]